MASNYPIEATTGPIASTSAGVSGGSYVALDGTPPLRAIVRCLARSSRQLWHRGNSQSLYMPKDLFITHICFYATHRELAHLEHKGLELHNFNLDDAAPIPREPDGYLPGESSFKAQCETITWKLDDALGYKPVGQQQLLRAPPSMRALVVASDVGSPYSEHLENAARIQRLEREKGPPETEEGHDPRDATRRLLHEHWLQRRHSLSRIGTFGRISELFPHAYVLRESLGRWQTTGENPDRVTNHRIAIEIPFQLPRKYWRAGRAYRLEGRA